MTTTPNSYLFGEGDLAARRLDLLAQVFAPSTEALLGRLGSVDGDALDLGCGPGHTTRLVHDRLRPRSTVGLERSRPLLERARRQARAGVSFLEHDVTAVPFPLPPAQLVYVRFLVTHLPDPAAVLRAWATAVASRGRLVVEETAALESPDPAFVEYYRRVEEAQARHGQALYVGSILDALWSPEDWVAEYSTPAELRLPAASMAALHAMNIRSWGRDARVRQRYPAEAQARLRAELEAVADGRRQAPPVECRLHQLVLRRR